MCAMSFEPITQRADRVMIVATGPSAEEFNFKDVPDNVHIIAVKNAKSFLPRYDSWVTVDVNSRSVGMLRTRRANAVHYAAVPMDYGQSAARLPLHRHSLEGLHYLKRGPKGVLTLSMDPDCIATGNSAYGALNIAFHMHAKRVLLIGVDGTMRDYAYDTGCPKGNILHLPGLFQQAQGQLRARGMLVATVGLQSRLQCFPKLRAGSALHWLTAPRTALVLGSARCMWDDVERALDLTEFDGVVAAKGVGEVWPGHLDAWVTLHPEKIRKSIDARSRAGYPRCLRVFAHKTDAHSRRYVTDPVPYKFDSQNNSGSSGLFAVKVALEHLGFDRVVLCGMPLDRSQGRLDGLDLWHGSNTFEKGFRESFPLIKDRVRSMSGVTKQLLGEPTVQWLTEW